MARVGDVLQQLLGAVRINYAVFGNMEPALHAHLFPRYADEPAANRTVQPFALDWNGAPNFDSAADGTMQRDIAQALAARP
jgi:diadenosine tetraphosphate (Ap4A) HIT family hydrolase